MDHEKIAWLKSMLDRPSTSPAKYEVIQRRIYALSHEVEYTNPFNDVDEILFKIWLVSWKPHRDVDYLDPRASYAHREAIGSPSIS